MTNESWCSPPSPLSFFRVCVCACVSALVAPASHCFLRRGGRGGLSFFGFRPRARASPRAPCSPRNERPVGPGQGMLAHACRARRVSLAFFFFCACTRHEPSPRPPSASLSLSQPPSHPSLPHTCTHSRPGRPLPPRPSPPGPRPGAKPRKTLPWRRPPMAWPAAAPAARPPRPPIQRWPSFSPRSPPSRASWRASGTRRPPFPGRTSSPKR